MAPPHNVARLRPCQHQVAGHLFEEGKAGSLVDDYGHFYKPLQAGPRGERELAFYQAIQRELADELAASSASLSGAVESSPGSCKPRPSVFENVPLPAPEAGRAREHGGVESAGINPCSTALSLSRPSHRSLPRRTLSSPSLALSVALDAPALTIALRDATGLLAGVLGRRTGSADAGPETLVGEGGADSDGEWGGIVERESTGGTSASVSVCLDPPSPRMECGGEGGDGTGRRRRLVAGLDPAAQASTPDSDEENQTSRHVMRSWSSFRRAEKPCLMSRERGSRGMEQGGGISDKRGLAQSASLPISLPARSLGDFAAEAGPEESSNARRRELENSSPPSPARRLEGSSPPPLLRAWLRAPPRGLGSERPPRPSLRRPSFSAARRGAASEGERTSDSEELDWDMGKVVAWGAGDGSAAPSPLGAGERLSRFPGTREAEGALMPTVQPGPDSQKATSLSVLDESVPFSEPSQRPAPFSATPPPIWHPSLPYSQRNAPLLAVLPRFFGTRQTGGRQLLALEDLTRGYARPCIMDAKIGFRTWYAESGDAAYVARCRAKDSTTTQAALGFKVCGMQVWRAGLGGYWRASKRWCKTLGRDQVDSALFSWAQGSGAGLTAADVLGGPEGAVAQLQALERWVRQQRELKFYSSSVLLLYEGAAQAAGQARVRVRLVDFAHTFHDPGGGARDLNFLAGLRSLVARLKRVARMRIQEAEGGDSYGAARGEKCQPCAPAAVSPLEQALGQDSLGPAAAPAPALIAARGSPRALSPTAGHAPSPPGSPVAAQGAQASWIFAGQGKFPEQEDVERPRVQRAPPAAAALVAETPLALTSA